MDTNTENTPTTTVPTDATTTDVPTTEPTSTTDAPDNVDEGVEKADEEAGEDVEPVVALDKTGDIPKVTPIKITDDFVNPNSPRTPQARDLVNQATQTLQAVPDTMRRPDEVARQQTDNAGKTTPSENDSSEVK